MVLQEKIKKAELYEANSNWEEAINLYNEIVEENNSVQNTEKLGWCLSRAGKYDEAIRYFLILEEKEPKMAKWKYMIGYQYYSKKEWKEAVKYFEETLKIKPNYLVVKYRISYAYLQLAGTYKKLTKPEFWKALGHIKECHELWDSFDEKTKNKEKHTYFDINFLHGKILMNLPNHREESILHFENALKIKDDEICRYNLSKTFYLMGKYEDAKKWIPNNCSYYVVELNAYIEAKLGNYDIAIDIVDKLLKKRKKDYLYAFLAEVYLLKEDNKNAFDYANIAIKVNYKNHKNHFVLAKVYYKYNLLYSAVKELDNAIQLKFKNYHSEYDEAILLKEEIIEKIPENYIEDKHILEKINFNNDKKIYTGTIYEYDKNKGFGFIMYDGKKIFFHISDCKFDNPIKNRQVSFQKIRGKNEKLKAINVKWK